MSIIVETPSEKMEQHQHHRDTENELRCRCCNDDCGNGHEAFHHGADSIEMLVRYRYEDTCAHYQREHEHAPVADIHGNSHYQQWRI
jgi:hypothetical protein